MTISKLVSAIACVSAIIILSTSNANAQLDQYHSQYGYGNTNPQPTGQPTYQSTYTDDQDQEAKASGWGFQLGYVRIGDQAGIAIGLGYNSQKATATSRRSITSTSNYATFAGLSQYAPTLLAPTPYGQSPLAFVPPMYQNRPFNSLVGVYVYTPQAGDFTLGFSITERALGGQELSTPRLYVQVQGCSERDGTGTWIYVPAGSTLNWNLPGCGPSSQVINHPLRTGGLATPSGQLCAAKIAYVAMGGETCNTGLTPYSPWAR